MAIRVLAAGALAIVLGACGGGESDDDGGRVVGVVTDETSTGPVQSPASTTPPATTSLSTAAQCPIDEICQIDVPLIQIPLNETPASISLDGSSAWLAAPDDQAVVEVDLAASTVARTIPVGDAAIDVVAGAGSLWVPTYEFSFGPLLRVDPNDGSTTGTIETPDGEVRSIAVLDDSAWAVIDGFGRVMRIDIASNDVTDVIGGTEFTGGVGEVSIVATNGVLWAIDESTGSIERIDAASRTIESTIGDLGYSEEASDDVTTILSDGPMALAASEAGIWVLSDVPNPTDVANVLGGAALFLLDHESGSVIRRIDLRIEPNFARPGLAITDDAAWYIGLVDGYPVRVDLETERQTFIRLDSANAVGVVTDGATVWLAVESLFDMDLVIGVDAALAARASHELTGP